MSTLEIARQAYEDIEIYEDAIVDQLSKKTKTTKQHVWQQNQINNLVGRIQAQSDTVVTSTLRDEDGSFKEELEAMKGENAFGSFYSALKETKDYHLRYPNMEVRTAPDLDSEMACKAEFSGEEMWGKYLDLHSFHERAVNMKNLFPDFANNPTSNGGGGDDKDKNRLPLEYIDFLDEFHRLDKVPRTAKTNSNSVSGKYAAYVRELKEYLVGFLTRAQPLLDVADALGKDCDAPFEEAWAKGAVPGWAGLGGGEATAKAKKAVDMTNLHSVEALESLGMARLKEGLEALGLKAGGSLKDRAKRLLSVRGVTDRGLIPKKLLAATSATATKAAATSTATKDEGNKEGSKEGQGSSDGKRKHDSGAAGGGVSGEKALALEEQRVGFLAKELLEDVVVASKKHVEKKHVMMLEERDAEIEQEEAKNEDDEDGNDDDGGEGGHKGGGGGSDEEGEGEEGPLYNPLNLPLGWDGKPIPFWLFKLHGLGVEYKCEICGNASYFGRRAFDRHFQEWRHAYGMRCLGIPNTKHFHDICLIEDAASLYAKLKTTLKQEQFDAAAAEEYEDSEGHVLNRKTYEDLARQGLL